MKEKRQTLIIFDGVYNTKYMIQNWYAGLVLWKSFVNPLYLKNYRSLIIILI